MERRHGAAVTAALYFFGGIGGHGLEAVLAPSWLSTGAAPGLAALCAALLFDTCIRWVCLHRCCRWKDGGFLVDELR